MLEREQLEQTAHLSALRNFARSIALPESLAITLYQQELRDLRDKARVDRFVSVLAEKRAKDALRKMRQ
jgi:hypothetical protein